MMWEVWRDGHFTGIIVSNYDYEVKYLAERSRLTGHKYKLKEIKVGERNLRSSIRWIMRTSPKEVSR